VNSKYLFVLGCLLPLLIGCGIGQPANKPAVPVKTPPAAITPLKLPTAKPTATRESAGVSVGDSLSMPQAEPQLGPITFALGVTEDRQPIGPDLLFTTGITEVHAVFTYTQMSPAYTWERVWYFNDQEVSRSAARWQGPANGTFNYFINNGGKPILAGDWVLQLFVEGKLRSVGVFIVEDEP